MIILATEQVVTETNRMLDIFLQGMSSVRGVFNKCAMVDIRIIIQNRVVDAAMIAIADNDGNRFTHSKSSPTRSRAVAKCVLANFQPFPKANKMGP